MYYSQNIIYNKFKEENYERVRLLNSAERNVSFVPPECCGYPITQRLTDGDHTGAPRGRRLCGRCRRWSGAMCGPDASAKSGWKRGIPRNRGNTNN